MRPPYAPLPLTSRCAASAARALAEGHMWRSSTVAAAAEAATAAPADGPPSPVSPAFSG
jgi:hypothetical protein